MTRFERITQSASALAAFLYRVQDDALTAKGCSMNLKMPDPEVAMLWDTWLAQECEEDWMP